MAHLRRSRAATVLVAAAVWIAGVAALRTLGVRVNLSPSVPVGIYVAERVTRRGVARLARGSLVAVCLPADVAAWGRRRGYLSRGSCADGVAPVGKPVFAVGGDTIVISDSGIGFRNRVLPGTRPLGTDSRGRVLVRVPDGRYVVGAGEIWLVSTYAADSWDSRYYGPVPASRVVAGLRPVWVW